MKWVFFFFVFVFFGFVKETSLCELKGAPWGFNLSVLLR